MAKKFYIADMHFSHEHILAFDNRPFLTTEEMDRVMVENWNSAVGKGDLVYVLGDMFWCPTDQAVSIMDQLNGLKILIAGNHDEYHSTSFKKKFAKIADYLEVSDRGRKVVLSHYPIPCFKNHYYGWYHLYGHVHDSFEFNMMEHDKLLMQELYSRPCFMYNVGVMMPWMNYTPRTLDEIIATVGAEDNKRTFGFKIEKTEVCESFQLPKVDVAEITKNKLNHLNVR